jgi:hypothetical protein
MIIKYNDKEYNFIDTSSISLHHKIINFYENILKKELNYFQNIYISHLLYQKEYNLYNNENDNNLKINNLKINNLEIINLEIINLEIINLEINNFKEKHLFELIIPYIKILIISLLIIIRIDIFLSTSFNTHIKSFEDYYILLLYIFTTLIIILIFYYSYKVIFRFIEYIIQNLDKDIGIFMSTYIESYNMIDTHNHKIEYINKYINKYKEFLEEEEENK